MSTLKVQVKSRTVPTRTRHPTLPVRRQSSKHQYRALLQPALRVGAVNDPAEHEAEVMAGRVVASSTPSLAEAPCASGSGRGNGTVTPLRRAVDDQPNLDELQPAEPPSGQKDFDLPATQDVSTQGLDQANTNELDSDAPVDTSGEAPAPESPPIEDAPPPIMADRDGGAGAVVGRSGGAAPADVANLVAHPGPGRALPEGLRSRIEPHFGTSFKDVRLHDSSADQRAARRIGARAFTHKNHIWLGPGESHTNTRLMAHELTHVVQQTKGSEALPLAREPVIHRGYFANKAESVARHVPGYTLITVLLGRTLISGDKVSMTAENLLGGFMGLIPGGTLMFDRLKEARVIQEAFDWVKGKLHELNLTWSRIKGDLSDALDTYNPFTAAKNVKNMLLGLVRDIVRFVKAIAIKVLEFIVRGALKLAGPYADKVWGVIQEARDTIGMILEDPLAFAKNLIGGIVGGFKQFGRNILSHLKKGLLGWIFGSLEGAGITLPDKLDFKGLLSLVLQILGLTYENFRKQLVKKLGPNGEKKVSMIEKSVEIVKVLLQEGFAGIWKKMLELIENFKATLIGGMTTMVITTIVEVGISWLAGLSNPVGAVVKIVLSIYKLIVAFIERLEQIVEVASSIFKSIGSIARGQVQQAADFIENAIGKTIPVVLAFIAGLLGLDGIPRRIRDVIKKLQAPVKKAMGKLIGFVVKKAKKLFAKLIKKLNSKRKLPSRNFKIGKTQHRIFAEKKGKKNVIVKIASSDGHPIEDFNKNHKQVLKDLKEKEAVAIGKKVSSETTEADKETDAVEKKVDLSKENKNQLDTVKKLDEEIKEAADELQIAGAGVDNQTTISSAVDSSKATLIRAAEPRSIKIEGKFGTYKELQNVAKEPFSDSVKEPLSRYYELDHTIEKRFPKAIVENLHLLSAKTMDEKAKEPVLRGGKERIVRNEQAGNAKKSANRQEKGDKAGEDFGMIGSGKFEKIPENAPALPAVGVYHINHIEKKGKGLASHEDVIQMARDSGKNPHAHLKSSIKKQLEIEMSEMSAKLDADKSATADIKAKMAEGLAAAGARNEAIYGLGGVAARADTAAEAEREKFNAKLGTSIFSFDGKEGSADFAKEEGDGKAYSKLPKGKGDFYENDHIIDKAYPLNAQKMKLLNADQIKTLETEGTDAAQPGSKQRERLNELAALTMFSPASRIGSYSEGKGFAVTLYRPLAKRVTSETRSTPEKVFGYKSDEGLTLLAQYVKKGKVSDRDAGIKKVHKVFETEFRAKTENHSAAVTRQYSAEMANVIKANAPENQAAARQTMQVVINRVGKSLEKARNQTDAMFG